MLDETWKGNVRQLKNVVESLVVMDLDDYLDIDDLSPDLIDEETAQQFSSQSASANVISNPSTDDILEAGSDDPASSTLIGQTLKDIERWAIEHTLTLANHNREETARLLGISERNLYRKLNDYGLR